LISRIENNAVRRPEYLRFRSFLLCAVIFLVLSPGLHSQSFNVVDVKVEGNTLASTSLILSVAGINKGDELTATATQDAVRRLYGLGFFRDVRMLAEEASGGLIITIKVSELAKMGQLKFVGNKAIKSDDLAEELNLATGNYLSENLIYEKRNKIYDLYGEKGYFMVKVDYDLDYSSDSTVGDLTFRISEGSKVKVEKVVLTGNQRIPAKKIIGKMRNRKRGLLRSSNFDKEKYPEDKEKIIDYLHKEGYIDAYLKSDSIVTDSASNRMTIYLDIYEGPRYYFGKTDFTGNDVLPPDILRKALKYEENKVFNSEKFEESLYEVYFLYQEKGHLHVRVVDDRRTRDSLIDITFDIVEGLPSEVNLVRIIGNTKTRENVIRREMSLRPGQVFHRSLMMRSIRDIMQLNYFGNVTPDIVDLPTGDVDVVVSVEEKPTAQISAGAGYSGRDKFVGTFGLGIPNFRGRGQNLSFNVDIGSELDSYSISFTEPWLLSTPTLLGTDLYYTNRRWYTDYTEGRRGASLRLGRRLRWPDNYFRAYVRYRLEDDRYYNFSKNYRLASSYVTRHMVLYTPDNLDSVKSASYEIGDPLPGSLERFNENWYTASSLQLSIVRDSRDLPEFATTGSVLSYSYEKTGGLLGGHWQYDQHVLSISKFIPIFKSLVFAGKITYGAVSAADGDSLILEFDRFSPGGTGYSGIVRGYDDGSLTPDTIVTRIDTIIYYIETTVNDTTVLVPIDSIGAAYAAYSKVRGRYMMVGNLELQLPLVENQLYMLAFYDFGTSWLDKVTPSNLELDDFYRGIGLGFRLVVPGVGTIGFDFGYPLDDARDQDRGWKAHFQMGTTIK
jgi:outer membrane protein insertion porin family